MKITYDVDSDCSYFHFADTVRPGEAHSVPLEVEGVAAMLVLDIDGEGRLLGLEIVGASRALRPESLAKLIPVGVLGKK
jgi:uncharacterized protein YuzE